MKNFKEIAEKCLAGELSGTFKLVSGKLIPSDSLERRSNDSTCMYQYRMYVDGIPFSYTIYGTFYRFRTNSLDIIDFIPDNMQEQIKIDIPEGKIPVMEQTEQGVVITWKDQELTYNRLYQSIYKDDKAISSVNNVLRNDTSNRFLTKINVLRKLLNIRNYFGKPKYNTYGHALYYTIERGIHITPALYPSNDQRIIFDTKEHAEQAIKMLGDELKYLFEPW